MQKEDFQIEVEGIQLQARSLMLSAPSASLRPTLVFLHDSLGCIELWRDFPGKLAEATGCNAFIYDRQGYGQSAPAEAVIRSKGYLEKEAHVLAKVLHIAGIEKAILFGHSDGGSIALVAAAEYPELISGIITEGAHVFVEEITLSGIREAVKAYETTSLPQKLAKYHCDKAEWVFHAWTDTWLSPDFRNWNIEQYLPNVQCPLMVIQGEADEYGSYQQVEAIVRKVSGDAKELMVAGAGHTPHKEAGELTSSHITTFVREIVG
ncbi:alpha/beta fold hydrolase [Nafulsella turpanensis]|uniref:alpha/beta fold hydrolase n=1 Tax=Nafulsella turpanensis TaxID=1265690 RepID=UPI00034D6443|nr:alpha/beta hydrolase [Nafulsella turpanensis]